MSTIQTRQLCQQFVEHDLVAKGGRASSIEAASTHVDRRREMIDLLDVVYERAPVALGGNVVCILVVALVLSGYVSLLSLGLWVAISMTVVIARYGSVIAYRQRRNRRECRMWHGVFVSGSVLMALSWGALFMFLFPEASVLNAMTLSHQIFLAFVAGGLVAAAVATMGPVNAAFVAFSVLMMAPLVVRFLAIGTDVHIAIAGLLMMFTLVMLALAGYTADLTRRSLRARAGNAELIRSLRQAQRAAERLSARKDRFLATMSHEIRSPLNGILGVLSLIEESELDAEQRRFTSLATEAGRGLVHTLNELLDRSKIESGELVLERTAFSVREIVEHTVDMAAAEAERKGVDVVCDIDPDLPVSLDGDPHRLRQILTNLLSNAVKFTDRGEIVVRVDVESRDHDEAVLAFRVRDTGIGLTDEQRERIFDAYAQADASTTRERGGTGLGLAIVRQLVHMMCGRIDVDSAPGSGTTFRFTVVLQRPGGDEDAPAPVTSPGSPLRVLLVAESVSATRALGRQLRSLGARVQTAEDVSSALDALRLAARRREGIELVVHRASGCGHSACSLRAELDREPLLRRTHTLALVPMERASSAREATAMRRATCLPRPVRLLALRDALIAIVREQRTGGDPIAFEPSARRVRATR